MTTDNLQTWQELGIDLKSHDMLLNALGPAYQQVYLSQQNRPAGMSFWDFVVSDIHGIRVREIREHVQRGGKVVATFCVFVPEELVWAADGIPFGLCVGTQFTIPLAEEVLPRNTCALIKSWFSTGTYLPLSTVFSSRRWGDNLRRKEKNVRDSGST